MGQFDAFSANPSKNGGLGAFNGGMPKMPKGRRLTPQEASFLMAPIVRARQPQTVSDLPAIDQEALRGDKGAKQARAVYDRLMASDAPDSLKHEVQQVLNHGAKSKPSGIGTLLAPLGNAVGKAFMLIDKPKRAVVATIDEGLQALEDAAHGNSAYQSADPESWWQHVMQDKSYGFGDAVRHQLQGEQNNTGRLDTAAQILANPAVSRAAGLVGDVGLDPLSYVGVGLVDNGAKAAAEGAALSRAELAQRALQAGSNLDTASTGREAIQGAEKAIRDIGAHGAKARQLDKTEIISRLHDIGRDDLGKLVRQRGTSVLDSKTLQEIGARGGLRLPEALGGASIPGTRALQRIPGLVGGPISQALFSSAPVSGALEKIGSEDLAGLRAMARDKSADPAQVVEAVLGIGPAKSGRLMAGRLGQQFGTQLSDLLAEARGTGESFLRDGTLARALQGDAAARAVVDEAMPNGTERFAQWLENVRQAANDYGGSEWIKGRDNYFPRMASQDALDAAGIKGYKGGLNRFAQAAFEHHALQEGDTLLGHTLGSPEAQAMFGPTVDQQIEGIIQHVTGTPDWFNKDAADVLPKYLASVQRRTAAQATLENLKQAGLLDYGKIDAKMATLPEDKAVEIDKALGVMRSSRETRAAFGDMVGQALGTLSKEDLANAPDWMVEALNRTATTAKDPTGFVRFVDLVNRTFKTQAILSPGFHVRNAMGALFNSYVAGVDTASWSEFMPALRAFNKGGLEAVSPEMRPYVQDIAEHGLLDDANRATHEAADFVGARNKLANYRRPFSDNVVTRASRNVGDSIEQYARAVMAYDTLKKGGTWDEALQKVYQFHFDYQDLSAFEKSKMRRIVPFWTWTSRNMPLQLEQMLRNPKMYQRFMEVKAALDTRKGENPLNPSYMTDPVSSIRLPLAARQLGAPEYLTPDMPFSNVDNVTRDLVANPVAALMQDASPLIKTPIEAKFKQQFFNGAPLSDKLSPVPSSWTHIPGFVQALEGLGMVKHDRFGNPLISGTNAYKVDQFLPLLGRARRLAPSEKKYQDRALQSWLSFFGIASQQPTAADLSAQTYQRLQKANELLSRAQEKGYDVGRTTRN